MRDKSFGGVPVSTKYAQQSIEEDPHDGILIGGMHEIKNKKAIETQELDMFGPSTRRNTLLSWFVDLYWLSYDIA